MKRILNKFEQPAASSMQRQLHSNRVYSFNFTRFANAGQLHSPVVSLVRLRISSHILSLCLDTRKYGTSFLPTDIKCVSHGELLLDEDDGICPVDCVREFKTDAELSQILEKSKETGALVVVDFFRTSCGSCKYIEQGFSKLCKGAGDQQAGVIFLKHNVIDEYDEQSEVAERLRIKAVPLFHFYKDGILVESFPTRDKERIDATILKYTSTSEDL